MIHNRSQPNDGIQHACPICGEKNDPVGTFSCRICRKENLCIAHRMQGTWSYFNRTIHIEPCCEICYDKEYERLKPQIKEINDLKSGRLVLAPDVVGLDECELRKRLEQVDLDYSITDEIYSDKIEKNRVVTQKPQAAESLTPGETLEVVISKGVDTQKHGGQKTHSTVNIVQSSGRSIASILRKRRFFIYVVPIAAFCALVTIWLLNRSWPTVHYITPKGYHCDQPTVAGDAIYFVSNRSGAPEIWEINGSGEWIQLTNDGRRKERPRILIKRNYHNFSKSVISLCFRCEGQDGKMHVYSLDLVTGIQRKVASLNGFPSWSTEGDMIVCNGYSKRSNSQDIFLIYLNSRRSVRRITDDAYLNQYPVFSPDGSKVVFTSDRDGMKQLWVYDLNAARLSKLTDFHLNMFEPAFSPDGSKIVFFAGRDKAYRKGSIYDLWVLNADGSSPKRLTRLHGVTWSPVFDPSGNAIYFGFQKGESKRIAKIEFSG